MNNIHRDIIIERARMKYIDSGITRNITEALAAYLDNDAGPDEQIPLFITSPEIHHLEMIMQGIRPRCDDCDGDLFLQIGARDPDGKTYPTAWVCKGCEMEYYSDKTPADWLKELDVETRKQDL
ncbi:MAG: hypothetical protein Q8M94_18660 [Ignavibacteria bacterium]|nr:hypothetical protein [Ignavibacteria bacterium]